MTAKRPKPKADQHRTFVETAKELGCDESEKTFDKTLLRLGSAPPPVKEAKRGKSGK